MRVGITGLGKMGQTRAKVCHDLDIEIAAVCDIDPRLADLFPGVPFHQNYHALLQETNIDAVFVCVFNNVAAEIAAAALYAGKHVFCEKPPGRSVADVELMQTTEALCHGKVLMFGFDHRYQQHVLRAREEIASGHHGRVLWMRGVYGTQGHTSVWRQISMLSGGGIGIDLGVHLLDLLRWLSGDEFTVIASLVDRDQTEALVDDNIFALLRSQEDGFPAAVHVSATMDHVFHIEVGMERGRVLVEGLCTSSDRYLPAAVTAFPKFETRRTVAAGGKGRSFHTEVEIFRRAVDGKPFEDYYISSCTASSADALEVMRLLEDVYKLADVKEPETFPGIAEWFAERGRA